MRLRARSTAVLGAIALLVTALFLPAAAATDQTGRVSAKGKKVGKPQFVTKPVPVGDGYSLTVSGANGGLTVEISKGSEEAGEWYSWLFYNLNNAVKVGKKMSVVTVNAALATDDAVGASGSIDMVSNKEKAARPQGMAGCSGVKWEHRDGTLAGSFLFDTGTDLFGAIELDSLELEYARRPVGKARCTELDEPVCQQNYSMAFYFGSGDMLWTSELEDGRQLLVADVRDHYPNGWFMQLLRETVPGSNLQAVPDLSSGSLQGGSKISGSVAYATDAAKESFDLGYGCGTEYRTDGTVTGDMVFNYDLGSVDPFAGNDSIPGRLLEGR